MSDHAVYETAKRFDQLPDITDLVLMAYRREDLEENRFELITLPHGWK